MPETRFGRHSVTSSQMRSPVTATLVMMILSTKQANKALWWSDRTARPDMLSSSTSMETSLSCAVCESWMSALSLALYSARSAKLYVVFSGFPDAVFHSLKCSFSKHWEMRYSPLFFFFTSDTMVPTKYSQTFSE